MGDCDGRDVRESKTNNMIQCLVQNVAWGLAGNDPGGASWGGGCSHGRHLVSLIIRFNNR
jgi:hypothetical protein